MAKVGMKRIEVITLLTESRTVVELLQRREAVDIQKSEITGTEPFQTLHNVTLIEKNKQIVTQALALLPHKGGMLDFLDPRSNLSEEEFTKRADEVEDSLRIARGLVQASQTIIDCTTALKTEKQQLDALSVWKGLQIPMNFTGTATTSAFIGSLQGEWSRERLIDILTKGEDLPINAEIVYSSREQSGFVIFCHQSVKTQCNDALRALGFSLSQLRTDRTPAEEMQTVRQEIDRLEQKILTAEQQINNAADQYEKLLFALDYLRMQEARYAALNDTAITQNTLVINGYIREDQAEAIKNELSQTCSVTISDPAEEEEPPVAFKNNSFVVGVEDLTEDFSMPAKTDIDPNGVMSAFYYILFGLMFSDAGYGVILTISTGLILWLKKPEGNTRRNMIKFFYCGISTIFWGAMFGSWFGDAFAVISGVFFGNRIVLAPLWFDPVPEPIKLLGFSLAVGFIQIMAGLAVKFYILWKSGQKKDAIFDIGLWWVVFAGFIMVIMDMLVGNPLLNKIGLYTALAGGIGLILTGGRAASNPIMRLVSGITGLYDITGYVSDILSYCRLMALGLVTGIIASVANTIGSLGGNGVSGTIMFIIVFILGHAINFSINVLGAYVHCNRLQYVEFFGKFYDGGGKKFSPLAINTKHYKF